MQNTRIQNDQEKKENTKVRFTEDLTIGVDIPRC